MILCKKCYYSETKPVVNYPTAEANEEKKCQCCGKKLDWK